jgi:putative flippase GtrA
VKFTVQFMKYVIVAALSAASDWLVFILIMAIIGRPLPAYGSARIVGAIVSFFVNKHWSFQSPDHRRTAIEGGRFLVLFAASYSLALALFSALTMGGLNPYWSKLVADTTCFFVNFVIMRYWVYRDGEKVVLPMDGDGKPSRVAS